MKTTKIEQLAYEMLTENTGINLLDSGEYENRHWQQNQKKKIKDFINNPIVEYIKNEDGELIERNVNVFKYITLLELDEVCDVFNEMENNEWYDDTDFYGVSEKQAKFLEKISSKIYPVFNTYNADSDLSQVLQGNHLLINDTEYILLQVHNGCDVRGGYTNAKLFKITEDFYSVYEYLPESEWKDEYESIEQINQTYGK